MQQGLLDMGHARAILTLKAKDQLKVAEMVIEKAYQYAKPNSWYATTMHRKQKNQKQRLRQTFSS